MAGTISLADKDITISGYDYDYESDSSSAKYETDGLTIPTLDSGTGTSTNSNSCYTDIKLYQENTEENTWELLTNVSSPNKSFSGSTDDNWVPMGSYVYVRGDTDGNTLGFKKMRVKGVKFRDLEEGKYKIWIQARANNTKESREYIITVKDLNYKCVLAVHSNYGEDQVDITTTWRTKSKGSYTKTLDALTTLPKDTVFGGYILADRSRIAGSIVTIPINSRVDVYAVYLNPPQLTLSEYGNTIKVSSIAGSVYSDLIVAPRSQDVTIISPRIDNSAGEHVCEASIYVNSDYASSR